MVRQPSLAPELCERIAKLPDRPGVYLFKDAQGTLLYVGKALSLRKRVASYFRRPSTLAPKIAQMVKHVADLDVRLTTSEAEALLLESQLIKELKPRYNVAFRDDKTYPMLKVTNEPFPRLIVTRRKMADGAHYFGPYTDAGLMHTAVQFLRRVFPMRTCIRFPNTPCLEYHLGQCLAPCAAYVTAEQYQRLVDDLIAFLTGQRDELLRDLSRRMATASRAQRFEEAARLRDQVQALTSIIAAKEKSLLAGPLEQLQTVLKLPRVPSRIEAFDISNIVGEWAVGSLVVFTDGRPLKAHYRHFKIETVSRIDDYAMMREVISRRYHGTLATQLPLPDLILIDGGKGQLAATCEALAALSLTIPAIGLAKRFEHLFLPNASEPVVLLSTSPVLHLVQRIRDEAHRFAITYHRRLRRQTVRASRLDQIPGIGPARKRRLLRRFGSMDTLAKATVDDVAISGRLPRALAETVLRTMSRSRGRGGAP